MTRKEKELISVLSDAVYVVVSGVMLERFSPNKVFPGRHTYSECEEIIKFQRQRWYDKPLKQKAKRTKYATVFPMPPSYMIYHYKEVPKI